MTRVHRIPIVGLVLSLACNHRSDGATNGASTTAGADSGTLGGSVTGAAPTTSGADDGSSTGGVTTTGVVTSDTGHTTTGTTSDDTSSEAGGDPPGGTTGPFCVGAIGDSTNLDPPIHDCDPEPCARGEVCVRRLACPVVPNLCDDDDIPEFEDQCYVEQHPKLCEPIPEDCEQDPQGLEYCLEQYDEMCRYGGDYHDGVLFCDYAIDQCSESEDFPPYCTDLYP